jgi:peptide/nickel transport system substrate-binding protein
VLPSDVDKLAGNPRLQVLRVPAMSIQYLGFNCARKPFDDVRVRQAVADALDVPAIVKAVYRGIGSPANGPLPPSMRYCDKGLAVAPRNLDKARQLLAAAGIKPGLEVQLWTTDRKDRIDMATIIQNQLKDVGLNVNIKVMDFNAFAAGAIKSQHEMFIIGFAPSTADSDNGLYTVFQSSERGTTNNLANFASPEMDKLLEQGRTLEDSPARRNIYLGIQKMVVEQRPWVPLYFPDVIVGAQKNVTGLQASPLDMELLFNVKKQ